MVALRRAFTFPVFVVAAGFALVGCAPEARSETSPEPGASAGSDEAVGIPEAASECPFTGTWVGTIPDGPFEGDEFRWVVRDPGSLTAPGGPVTVNGSWSLRENILTVSNLSDAEAAGCDPDKSASYRIQYHDACARAVLHAVTDPCQQRRTTLDGLSLDRE
jgi:hypothetical protein